MITRFVLAAVTILVRREVSKDVELLVLRHENAVLRRQVKWVRYQPADRVWLSAQAHRIIACDFLHVDTVLLRRLYVLVFIEHGTRRLHVAGVTANPTGSWVAQQARNLVMDLGARVDTLRFVIRDRDSKYTLAFDSVLDAEGIQVITTPPRPPMANAICERVIGTLRRELLDRILILGPGHLRRVLAEYAIHYNRHRSHQSLSQRSPDTDPAVPTPSINLTGRWIKRRPVLGGLINEYEAA